MKLTFSETVQLNELQFGDIKNHSIYQKTLANPKFQRWFGPSKVRDIDGNPLICFHSTDKEFKTFRSLSHFGTIEASNDLMIQKPTSFAFASAGKIIPVFLRITNPVFIRDITGSHDNVWSFLYPMIENNILTWDDVVVYLEEIFGLEPSNIDEVIDHIIRTVEIDYDYLQFKLRRAKHPEFMLYLGANNNRNRFVYLLRKLRIDGFMYRNSYEGRGSISWVITSPGQVLPVFRAYRFAKEEAT